MKTVFFASLLHMVVLNAQQYEPKWSDLDSRPTPQWFKDSKFGIFIHWGLYSVPAWSPIGSYAEWYLNGLLNGDTNRIKYHNENYGKDFLYRDFAKLFNPKKYDPSKWAKLFQMSGAKYVVLTSKHHDGFCLWPSEHSNGYNSFDTPAKRDLLGDLNKAVKDKGLRSGFYYSLYEWQHPDYPNDVTAYVNNYMLPQFKDAVQRYKPDIIFSDGEWDRSSLEWRSEEFLAWLYNDSDAPKDVVVNDRWGGETRFKHGGYFSTEYDPNSDAMNEEFLERGWEECRGIGKSFGYNRNEKEEDYNTSEELIKLLVDVVSRGGNLLLNIGPKADGSIPNIMSDRLLEIGEWLKINGEAIYETIPNRIFSSDNITFTLAKDRKTLFAFIDQVPKNKLVIKNVNAVGKNRIECFGSNNSLRWKNKNKDLVISVSRSFRRSLRYSPVYVLQIPVRPYLDAPDVSINVKENFAEISIGSDDLKTMHMYKVRDLKTNTDVFKKYENPFRVIDAGMLNVFSTRKNYLQSKLVSLPINILKKDNGIHRLTFVGEWENCQQMIKEESIDQGVFDNFSIDLDKKDNFGHTFTGYIAINMKGTYHFETASDDGSRLLINDELVVDNDGLHSKISKSGSVYLDKEMYKIVVEYFERGEQESLEVNWKGPGFEWQEIPSYILFHKNN